MWFKNLTIFQFHQHWDLTPAALEQSLANKPLTACPALGMHSHGWTPPGVTPRLVEAVDNHMLVALGSEEKILPASVIRDRSAEMADEWSQSHGIKPSRKLLADFRDQAISELLPRALARKRYTAGWIDLSRQRIVVDCNASSRAELVIEHLRETLGSLEVTPIKTSRSPGESMTDWLRSQRSPGSFSLDDECVLSASNEPGSLIRYRRYAPSITHLQECLEQGFQVSQLALIWRDRIQLTVDTNLRVKRVRFVDMHEERPDPDRISDDRQIEAEMTLMTNDFGQMIDDLIVAFGGEIPHSK